MHSPDQRLLDAADTCMDPVDGENDVTAEHEV